MNNNREPYVGMPVFLNDEESLPTVDRNDEIRDSIRPDGRVLAMAYIPSQGWGKTYSAEEGFLTGTMFPSLDFPFEGGMHRG